jgi:predicted secreted hydrolase
MMRRIGWLMGSALAFGVLSLIWTQQDRRPAPDAAGLNLEPILADSDAGFESVDGEWRFRFPDDHGGHPDFRSEVWYVTANLRDDEGRRFGLQLAFFRLRLAPQAVQRASAWGTNQVFRAHFALTDAANRGFHAEERFSRGALGLSGVGQSPARVWLEDWSLEANGEPGGEPGFHLRAGTGDRTLELNLRRSKPPVLQGGADLFPGGAGGGGFHFYLMPRLDASGTLRTGASSRRIEGTAWLDRAWGAIPLSRGQIALNRYALQLEDGRDVLCLVLRRRDGTGTPIPSCLVIGNDGSSRAFRRREIRLEPLALWRSPLNGTKYPLNWRLELPGEGLALETRPLLKAQELELSNRAWSGAVEVSGRSRGKPVSGWGHLVLSGYAGLESGV